MSSHGFGKGQVKSPGKATIDDARAIAKKLLKIKINNKKVIKKAHVHKKRWFEEDFVVLFEFVELDSLGDPDEYNLDDLDEKVSGIEHNGHRLQDRYYWTILESHS